MMRKAFFALVIVNIQYFLVSIRAHLFVELLVPSDFLVVWTGRIGDEHRREITVLVAGDVNYFALDFNPCVPMSLEFSTHIP